MPKFRVYRSDPAADEILLMQSCRIKNRDALAPKQTVCTANKGTLSNRFKDKILSADGGDIDRILLITRSYLRACGVRAYKLI